MLRLYAGFRPFPEKPLDSFVAEGLYHAAVYRYEIRQSKLVNRAPGRPRLRRSPCRSPSASPRAILQQGQAWREGGRPTRVHPPNPARTSSPCRQHAGSSRGPPSPIARCARSCWVAGPGTAPVDGEYPTTEAICRQQKPRGTSAQKMLRSRIAAIRVTSARGDDGRDERGFRRQDHAGR
jgi:hypothetical protein